jgi:DNA invertase Pin-like site-specific DNA recombinase
MSGRSPVPCRCAVYTRQSRDATSEFSSCEAQRGACRTYIDSQPCWVWNEERYDDEGESGEGVKRPALERLLRDVQAGLVDCVVVHRLDRLSRKLFDGAALLAELEQRQILLTVVTAPELGSAATQTLMTNILASFA